MSREAGSDILRFEEYHELYLSRISRKNLAILTFSSPSVVCALNVWDVFRSPGHEGSKPSYKILCDCRQTLSLALEILLLVSFPLDNVSSRDADIILQLSGSKPKLSFFLTSAKASPASHQVPWLRSSQHPD